MAVYILLLLLLCTLIYWYLKYEQSYLKRRGIPHLKPNFPLANISGLLKTKHFIDILSPIYGKFKGTAPIAGLYFLVKPSLIALDLELVKNILITDLNNFDDRCVFHNVRDDPLTGNLYQMNGEKWRSLRHKLSPAFTSEKVKSMFPIVLRVGEELSRVFAEKLQEEIKQGGELEITDLLSRYTADVIGNCAFGIQCNSLRNVNAEFFRTSKRALTERKHGKVIDTFMESFPDLARRLRLIQTHPEVTDFYTRIIRDTIAYRERNDIKRNDFMNMLIEMKNNPDAVSSELSVEEITAQSFLFFIAGFETSSATMGFALYELAQHQEEQDRLRAEINAALARSEREFSYECMKMMPYLKKVISETLRKYPIVPLLRRKANKEYPTEDSRFVIEKASTVIIPIYSIHHDSEIYPEPEKFDPERFTEEAIAHRPACTWLPFGDGPRNCIGLHFGKMQIYIGLSYLLKNFKFSICDRTQIPMKFSKSRALLSAEGGIYLKVEKL